MSKQLWITLCTLYISKHIRPRLPQALFCIFAVHKVSTENELVGMPVAEAPSLGRAAAVPWAPWRSCSQVSHELCFAVRPLAEPEKGSCGLHSVCSHQTHQWLSPSFLEQTGTFFFFFGDMLEGFPWQPDWSPCICSLHDAHLDGGGWSSKFRTQSRFGV